MMLADAVAKTKTGRYKDFSMTEDERYELYIAAWLHDCGGGGHSTSCSR